MRFAGRFCFCIMVTIVVVSILNAQEAKTLRVYPTGRWPEDVQNVQAAVNLGGTVRLKAVDTNGNPAAFNFGTPSTDEQNGNLGVFLTTDVKITGEESGGQRTTIQGGYIPFLGFAPGIVRIQGIDFDGPGVVAIQIIDAARAEVIDNRMERVVPLLLPMALTSAAKQPAV